VAFTLWHVATALTILPGARATFLRADFLAIAALEGAVCAWLRRRTGSVWPGVALHWAEVMVWKTWLGGPSLGALTAAPAVGGLTAAAPASTPTVPPGSAARR
jgi:predicted Abi (CAAX) family protease